MFFIYFVLVLSNLVKFILAASPNITIAPTGGVNFVIQNQHPANISLFYSNGTGATPLASPTLIGLNETLNATFPAGWQGNIQVVEAGRDGDFTQASWMEGNTMQGQVWMDVSYVRGFSVSIVCNCGQPDGTQRISGCNKDLWNSTKPCPNKAGQTNVTCPNTAKPKGPPDKWFAPCTHLAYTYPDDIPNYECAPGAPVYCCVGDTCPRPPNPPGVGENLSNGRARVEWSLSYIILTLWLTKLFQ